MPVNPFAAYLPPDRLQALAGGRPLTEYCTGSALFADISGFTPLTAALTRELGPQRGAERLTAQLNEIYDALIAVLDAHGGSVLGFSGDAITSWFDAGITPSAAARAVACAHALQRAMHSFDSLRTPGGQRFDLAVKVSVASGAARRLVVGDPAHLRMEALAGATVQRMALGENHANRGDVLVDEATLAALPGSPGIREWRGDNPRFAVLEPVTASSPDAGRLALAESVTAQAQAAPLAEWVLPAVRVRLTASDGRFLAELRPATALFLRFDGIDYDHDVDARDKLDALLHMTQRVMAQHGGNFIQLSIGDKGSYGYAAFGAPIAHEDDATRAAAAALDLQAQAKSLPWLDGLQIGISMGQMRAGAYGGRTRCTYGVLGEDTNLAARLMALAGPGQTLISVHAHEAMRRRPAALPRGARFVSIGQHAIKGWSNTLEVFALQAGDAADLDIPVFEAEPLLPLVGRVQACARLLQVIEAAQQAPGQLWELHGAAGIGKSRLLQWVLAEATKRGSLTLGARCPGEGMQRPYAPWRDIVGQLLGANPADAAALQQALLNQDAAFASRLPLLGDVCGVQFPDTALTRGLEPRQRQQALFGLMSDLLARVCVQQPLLLWLEDATQLDEASRALLTSIGQQLARWPLLLMCVTREPLDLPGQTLALDGLLPDEMSELLRNALREKTQQLGQEGAPAAITPQVGDAIARRAQGNPLFAIELVQALQAKAVRHDGDADEPAALPDSLQGLVLARVDRLSEAPRLTLKLASIIGQQFEASVLAKLHPGSPGPLELGRLLDHLSARQLIRPQATEPALMLLRASPDQSYTFADGISRNAVYDTLLESQQRELHAAVGLAIETQADHMNDVTAARIAHHSWLGHDFVRAMPQLMAGAEHARLRFANAAALQGYQRVRQCAVQVSGSAALLRTALLRGGELYVTIGKHAEAAEWLEQLLALVPNPETAEPELADAVAVACRWLARSHEQRTDYGQALAWIVRGLRVLGERQTPETSELSALAGLIHSRQGRHSQALEMAERARSSAEASGAQAALARAITLRGHIARLAGQPTEAVAYFVRSLDIYQATGNLAGEAIALNQLANAHYSLGDPAAALPAYTRARELFGLMGNHYQRALTDNNLGEIARVQGRLDAALQHFAEAAAVLQQTGGSGWVLGAIHNNTGAVLLLKQQPALALEQLAEAERLFAQANSRDFLPELYRLRAEAVLLQADPARAEPLARQALALALSLNQRSEQGAALRVLGEIHLRAGRVSEAQALLHEALAVSQTAGNRGEIARVEALLRAHSPRAAGPA